MKVQPGSARMSCQHIQINRKTKVHKGLVRKGNKIATLLQGVLEESKKKKIVLCAYNLCMNLLAKQTFRWMTCNEKREI